MSPDCTEPAVDLGIEGLNPAVKIGRGGFAVVYRAWQPGFRRFVAVKVFSDLALDGTTPAVFQHECMAIGMLSGRPNILRVHDAGTTVSGRPYLIMEYTARGSLEDQLQREGPLPWRDAVVIGVKLAKALQAAHEAGLLHRDVKPGNVLMSDYSDEPEPLLADFGIARLTDVTRQTRSRPGFTPAHAAPEVIAGKPSSASVDIYSLASTVFNLISGRPAFVEGPDDAVFEIMRRVAESPVPDLLRPLRVPEPVCRFIESAMAKEPGDRPLTAAAFAAALDAAVHEAAEDMGAQPAPARARAPAPTPAPAVVPGEDSARDPRTEKQAVVGSLKAWRWLSALTAAGLVLAVIAGILVFESNSSHRSAAPPGTTTTAFGLRGLSVPSTAVRAARPATPAPTALTPAKAVLYSESFAVRGDWLSSPGDEFSSSGYANGFYFIKAKNGAETYSPHPAVSGNVRVEVTATKASPDLAVYGLSCGTHPAPVQSNPPKGGEYLGEIDTNGYWAIRKNDDANAVQSTLAEAGTIAQRSSFIKANGPNKIALECVRTASGGVVLRLFVNDRGVAEVQEAVSLYFGELGLIVESGGGPDVEVHFNDYKVFQL